MVSVLISATRSGWIDTVYGPMSAGLSERALGDLCVSENGVQTGPFGSQLHKRDYVNIGTPIITVEHLGENRIIHETMPRVSDEDKSRLSKYVLRDGDIVFSRVGSVDRRSLVRKEEDGWLFSGRCLRVRPDRNKIDPVFLSYFLGLPSFKEHIRSIAVGATMPSLNTKILNDVTVYFPTLPEQRRIAHILGTLDDKIELNRRMNETLEEMARAIFKDWFVDFGPVRAKMEGREAYLPEEIWRLFPDRLVESELGEVPEGWGVGTVSDLCISITSGGTPSRKQPEYWENGTITWFKTGELHDSPIMDSEEHITSLGLGHSSAKLWPTGTVLFALYGATVGRLGVLANPATANQATAGLIPDQEIGTSFLRHTLVEAREPLRNIAGGAAQQNINQRILKEHKVFVPQIDLVTMFNLIIDPIHRGQLSRIKESNALTQQRDAILPGLVSGNIEATAVLPRGANHGD